MSAPSRSTEVGTQGMRREGSVSGVSEAASARTRTLAGETVEFKAVDYRPPEDAERPGDTRPRAVDADAGRLGRASGVASLRSSAVGSDRAQRLSGKGIAAVLVVFAVLVVLVFAGGYALMQNMLADINEGSTGELSAGYATDSYTLIAVVGNDGALEELYLGYVDSIRERTEFCSIDPQVRYAEDGTADIHTFADVYASRGLEGLRAALGATASVSIPTAVSVDDGQAARVFMLAEGQDGDADTIELAASIFDGGEQTVSLSALQGLLLAIKQIGPDGFVMLSAPVEQIELSDGRGALAFQPQAWLSMVRAMRDATAA